MKTVFSTDMVSHVWAQQTQNEGRNSTSSVSFRGPTFYSYGTPMAKIHQGAKGQPVVLITSHSYTNTTSCQMSAVRASVLHLLTFEVPNIGETGGRSPEGRFEAGRKALKDGIHPANLVYLVTKYSEAKTRLTNKRLIYGKEIEATLLAASQQIDAYCEAFGLTSTTLPVEADIKEVYATHKARDEKNSTPEAQAKRVKEKEARERLKAKKEAEASARVRAGLKQTIEDWRAFKPGLSRMCLLRSALLRVNNDTVETSQSATFPVEHAKRAFRFIKLVKDSGQSWNRNGKTVRVGHFQIDSIDGTGNVQAGCHHIEWEEIAACAKTLGIFDEAGADEALEPSQNAA